MNLLNPGQIFAQRYRIDRFLAQGAMGAVFVAEQTATELQVALKVLWPHILASSSAVEKFQVEAKVAGRVNSEYIVRVFDAGFDEETRMPFLVMELLSGQTLEELVESKGPLSPAEVATYLHQVGLGLDKAHGYVDKNGQPKPIVHRDLKPENLFLTRRENGEPLVKILDFGLAKVLSPTSGMSQDMKGTPLFMAFEQAAVRRITPQTDIWALGLIAFYLLTRRSYWKTALDPDSSITMLLAEVLSMPLVDASERARELGVQPPWGPAFDAWFARCVNRDMYARFPSAGEAAAALVQALVGAEAAARLRRFGSIHPPSAARLVAQATVPQAPALVSAGSSLPATQPSLSLSVAGIPRRPPVLAIGLGTVAVLAVLGLVAFALLASRSPADAAPAAETATMQSVPALSPAAPSAQPPPTTVVVLPPDPSASASTTPQPPRTAGAKTPRAEATATPPATTAATPPTGTPMHPPKPKDDIYGER